MDYPKTLAILGASGGGEMVYWLVKEMYPEAKIVFLDDTPPAPTLLLGDEHVPVLTDWGLARLRAETGDPNSYRYFLPSSTTPTIKRVLANKAQEHGLEPAPVLFHPRAVVMGLPTITFGRGIVLYPLSLVSIRCVVEDHVHVFGGAIVGHHCNIGKYCAVNCTSMVNGYVTIGEGVLLGAGSVIKQHVTIAPWTVIGLQSAVIANVEESGTCIAGVPARPLSPKGLADGGGTGEVH
jgi:sugar O-acyltransferase (sialic acid O-acetyltransferase NeuD family)